MEKILVVEDNQQARENIVEILKIHNYNISEAENGKEALTKIEQDQFDLIISDMMMPVMDGKELVAQIRNCKNLDIPFIFLTAKAEMEDLRKGMNFGADDYIPKPFRARDLLDSVELRIKKSKEQKKHLEELRKNISLYIPHELNTPILPIQGYAQFIKDEINHLNKEDISKMMTHISSSTSRLQKVVEKFTRYSELQMIEKETIKEMSKSTILDLQNPLRNIARSMAKKVDRIEDLELMVENEFIQMSKNHFEMLVEEVIDNAFKFSDKGTKVSIKTQNKDDNKYQIIFQNNGKGFTEEELSKIGAFMQFSRKSEERAGNGLGLSIVKLILNIYNGKISITSTKNVLTTVKITLNKSIK